MSSSQNREQFKKQCLAHKHTLGQKYEFPTTNARGKRVWVARQFCAICGEDMTDRILDTPEADMKNDLIAH